MSRQATRQKFSTFNSITKGLRAEKLKISHEGEESKLTAIILFPLFTAWRDASKLW